jgi:hypothetical protein
LDAPLLPSAEAGLQGLHRSRLPGSLRKKTRKSSHGLVLSYRVLQARAAARIFRPRKGLDPRGSSHEVSSPSASPRSGQRHRWPGLPRPTACTYRFSQPPGASIRPEPAGLVSCRIRSWGCALQSLAPPVQPYAVSGAFALMSFRRTRAPSHARRKRPKPTTARSTTWYLQPKPSNTDRSRRQLTEATCNLAVSETGPRAPSPSGLCSTRESATRHRLFRPTPST